MKALDNALSDNTEGNCINPINVREALINMVKEADLPDDARKQHLEFLQDVLHKEYLELLEKEITKAFVYSYQEQAESLFQNYRDHAEAFVNKTRVKDRNTKEELQPDEGFLKSIEEQIAIIGSAAEGFRQEVIAYLWASSRRGERVSYRSYEPLKEAIEKKLMTSVRDISRIITKARTRDEEQTQKYTAMVKTLLDSCSLDDFTAVGTTEHAGEGMARAGAHPGSEYYENDVTLEELIDIMFEDLELPDLERKALRQIEAYRLAKRKGYRQVGIRVRLDKRRTVRERVKRKLASRHAHAEAALEAPAEVALGAARERFPFHDDDLVYRHMATDVKREPNAVVIG